MCSLLLSNNHTCALVGASPVEEVSLQQYSKSLQRVAVLRLLQQLSHVYSVMKIPALADLVPFMNFGEVEQIIVDAVKQDFLQASPLHLTLVWLCMPLVSATGVHSQSLGHYFTVYMHFALEGRLS